MLNACITYTYLNKYQRINALKCSVLFKKCYAAIAEIKPRIFLK